MPIRNPFARRPILATGADVANDENARPAAHIPKDSSSGFERVDIVGSRTSSAWSIHSTKGRDNGDYKMSGELPTADHTNKAHMAYQFRCQVVNDSGVYLPVSKDSQSTPPIAIRRTCSPVTV